jgi:hypothetical protein
MKTKIKRNSTFKKLIMFFTIKRVWEKVYDYFRQTLILWIGVQRTYTTNLIMISNKISNSDIRNDNLKPHYIYEL